MKDKLIKIKESLESAIENSEKKDIFIGKALGIVEELIEMPIEQTSESYKPPFDIPDAVLKSLDSGATMLDAVRRHKEVHNELSDDAVSKKNTQFKKLQ
jgi:hypothetical protein